MTKKNGPTFVLTLPMYANRVQLIQLDKIFEQSRSLYNYMLNETLKRYNNLMQSKTYRKTIRQIQGISKKIRQLENKLLNETDKKAIKTLKEELQTLKKERNQLYKQQNDIEMEFGYNEYVLHEVVKTPKYYFNRIDINTAQKLATRAFDAVEKIRKGKAKKARFVKYKSLTSIEGKSNASGIRFRWENNQPVVKIQGMTIKVKVYQRDKYAQMALMQNKVKYCRILRKIIRGRVRYYVQLIMDGIPPKKDRKLGKGKVGIDPSLQSMAVASPTKAYIAKLAPMVDPLEKEIRLLKRKLDRSRRATNPNNYNPDGTIKKGKKTWVCSNNYMKTLFRLKEIYRKQKEMRRQSHERLANEVLSLGNVFFIEKNNFKAFQKRKKKTTKKNGRFQSKKRFGKSIANKAPSLFLYILKRKILLLGGTFYEINPMVAKPSQYDHQKDVYIKKKLSERWHVFEDGTKVHRDLYSAFLLTCVDTNTHLIDRNECLKHFNHFKQLHDKEIQA
ncbi:putative transposase [Geobacillus sp. GHH01]|uniref:hypothetical protein n=1 Tax=Geobacillus sp. GHH01 TaxID=1233873 RepID=UPI0002AF3029|nr:hypothetical protein [Geobacillus sp. GHH01]AGE22647.1 putative transposase [Geobacillus sp. GHH01]